MSKPALVPEGAGVNIRCPVCGAEFSGLAWAALLLVACLRAPELRRYVVRWPASACVEVRRCVQCGRDIAAKRPV